MLLEMQQNGSGSVLGSHPSVASLTSRRLLLTHRCSGGVKRCIDSHSQEAEPRCWRSRAPRHSPLCLSLLRHSPLL